MARAKQARDFDREGGASHVRKWTGLLRGFLRGFLQRVQVVADASVVSDLAIAFRDGDGDALGVDIKSNVE